MKTCCEVCTDFVKISRPVYECEVCKTLCRYQGQYMNLKSAGICVDTKASNYMNLKSLQFCVDIKVSIWMWSLCNFMYIPRPLYKCEDFATLCRYQDSIWMWNLCNYVKILMPLYECEDCANLCRYQGQNMNSKSVRLCVDAKASIWIWSLFYFM